MSYRNWSLERCNEELKARGHRHDFTDLGVARAVCVSMAIEFDTCNDEVKQYRFATDSEHGYLHARNWDEAKMMLRDLVPVEMLRHGAAGWVEDIHGNRYDRGFEV